MKIALDVMGGDYSPHEQVKGGLSAVNDLGIELVLVGDQAVIESELQGLDYPTERVSIFHAGQVVEMNEAPALALRKKKDSSIMVATRLVKEGQCEAMVSSGNTGAQMAAALFGLGRFAEIDRPAIGTLVPHNGKFSVLVDTGANVDVKALQLVQFAQMGKAYAQAVLNIDEPKIGLLSNGQEEHKGNQLVQESHQLLKEAVGLNFIGNVEGRDLFEDRADVIVCDGFAGNIILKAIEGLASYLGRKLVKQFGPEGAMVLKEFDYNNIGGAPLLGVNGVSVVCHGSSRAQAIANGIKVAQQCVEHNLVDKVRKNLA
ncbi:MAG: phosphate acyltransferase PlsX [Methylocystaceae bacterium]